MIEYEVRGKSHFGVGRGAEGKCLPEVWFTALAMLDIILGMDDLSCILHFVFNQNFIRFFGGQSFIRFSISKPILVNLVATNLRLPLRSPTKTGCVSEIPKPIGFLPITSRHGLIAERLG